MGQVSDLLDSSSLLNGGRLESDVYSSCWDAAPKIGVHGDGLVLQQSNSGGALGADVCLSRVLTRHLAVPCSCNFSCLILESHHRLPHGLFDRGR